MAKDDEVGKNKWCPFAVQSCKHLVIAGALQGIAKRFVGIVDEPNLLLQQGVTGVPHEAIEISTNTYTYTPIYIDVCMLTYVIIYIMI